LFTVHVAQEIEEGGWDQPAAICGALLFIHSPEQKEAEKRQRESDGVPCPSSCRPPALPFRSRGSGVGQREGDKRHDSVLPREQADMTDRQQTSSKSQNLARSICLLARGTEGRGKREDLPPLAHTHKHKHTDAHKAHTLTYSRTQSAHLALALFSLSLLSLCSVLFLLTRLPFILPFPLLLCPFTSFIPPSFFLSSHLTPFPFSSSLFCLPSAPLQPCLSAVVFARCPRSTLFHQRPTFSKPLLSRPTSLLVDPAIDRPTDRETISSPTRSFLPVHRVHPPLLPASSLALFIDSTLVAFPPSQRDGE